MALDFPQSPQLDEVFVSGDRAWKWNGYAWDKISAGTGSQPYVISCFAAGALLPGEKLFMHPASIRVQFPEALANSKIRAGLAPQADAELTVELLGTTGSATVGTAKILASATEGTFEPSAAFVFDPAEKHVLTLLAPAVADPTLADVSITLVGVR